MPIAHSDAPGRRFGKWPGSVTADPGCAFRLADLSSGRKPKCFIGAYASRRQTKDKEHRQTAEAMKSIIIAAISAALWALVIVALWSGFANMIAARHDDERLSTAPPPAPAVLPAPVPTVEDANKNFNLTLETALGIEETIHGRKKLRALMAKRETQFSPYYDGMNIGRRNDFCGTDCTDAVENNPTLALCSFDSTCAEWSGFLKTEIRCQCDINLFVCWRD